MWIMDILLWIFIALTPSLFHFFWDLLKSVKPSLKLRTRMNLRNFLSLISCKLQNLFHFINCITCHSLTYVHFHLNYRIQLWKRSYQWQSKYQGYQRRQRGLRLRQRRKTRSCNIFLESWTSRRFPIRPRCEKWQSHFERCIWCMSWRYKEEW